MHSSSLNALPLVSKTDKKRLLKLAQGRRTSPAPLESLSPSETLILALRCLEDRWVEKYIPEAVRKKAKVPWEKKMRLVSEYSISNLFWFHHLLLLAAGKGDADSLYVLQHAPQMINPSKKALLAWEQTLRKNLQAEASKSHRAAFFAEALQAYECGHHYRRSTDQSNTYVHSAVMCVWQTQMYRFEITPALEKVLAEYAEQGFAPAMDALGNLWCFQRKEVEKGLAMLLKAEGKFGAFDTEMLLLRCFEINFNLPNALEQMLYYGARAGSPRTDGQLPRKTLFHHFYHVKRKVIPDDDQVLDPKWAFLLGQSAFVYLKRGNAADVLTEPENYWKLIDLYHKVFMLVQKATVLTLLMGQREWRPFLPLQLSQSIARAVFASKIEASWLQAVLGC
jgi:hypothetical protein